MSHGYKFYIQRVARASDGSYYQISNTEKSLEDYYQGLRYSKLIGIDTIGKAKNIYTETYADSDKVRVYVPELVQYEATTLTLTLYFFGENRATVYEEFANEIRTGIHRYWDTARNHYFDFYVDDELSVSDENWYDGKPHFKVDVKMKNVYGRCFSRINTNIITDSMKVLNNDQYLMGSYHLNKSTKPIEGEHVRLSFSGYISEDNDELKIKGYDKFRVFNSGGKVPLLNSIDMSNYNMDTKRFEIEFNWIIGDSDNTHINFYQSQADNTPLLETELPEGYNKGQSMIFDVKLEIL